VNGGLARSESRRVKPSAGASREAFVASRAHRSGGRGSAQGSGWREIVIQRFTRRQKRCVGRGTGAVQATGSCEESLLMQDTPDHQEVSAFTGRRQRWSWRTPHLPTRTSRPKEGRTAMLQLPRRWERREGETGLRDRGVRGSIASAPWEENAHARDTTGSLDPVARV
jgi:hypothetical protein